MTATMPVCEWRDCMQEASTLIRGQWTVVDWLDMSVCWEHEGQMFTWLSTRLVDGEQPVDVYVLGRA